MVIKIVIQLGRRMDEHNETFNEEIENIKYQKEVQKYQKEWPCIKDDPWGPEVQSFRPGAQEASLMWVAHACWLWQGHGCDVDGRGVCLPI